MLQLVLDNRSKRKLELVFMTWNEEARIAHIFSLYGSDFDIVILDGGSTDNTCNIVAKFGGSIYRRIGENIGENHFAHYVNHACASGYCFYMMCDEYVKVSDLKRVEKFLSNEGSQVLGQRMDWFYGAQARRPTCVTPKGFRKGDALYSAENFHDTLRHLTRDKQRLIVNVQHLHVFSMKDDYGKFGHYIYHEVNQLRLATHPVKAGLVRFLRLARALQLNISKFPKKPWLIFFLVAQFFATMFLFIMSYIEQKGLDGKEEQIKKYLEYGKSKSQQEMRE